ncbi:hypothetical protein B0H13DRAFT_2675524 [Mycena leptocephala]|nr:hypothetical protein B0H13DRAFT_2675524 [Mycena leptocephala]
MRLRLKERGVARVQYERRVFYRGTLFSAPPATFVSASLEIPHSHLHPTTHSTRTQRGWYPAATHIVRTPLQVLLEERKIYVHAIGHYGPARTRFTSPMKMPARSSPQAGAPIVQVELRVLHLLDDTFHCKHRPAFHRAHSGSNLHTACVHTSRLTRTRALPPPPVRIVTIYRADAAATECQRCAPIVPTCSLSSLRPTDIKQHAQGRITICAPHAAETARHAEVPAHIVAAGPCPLRRAQAPRPVHKPSPADERTKVGAKGPRAEQETREEEKKRDNENARRTPSLLFLPTDVQPAPAHPTRTSSSNTSGVFIAIPAMAMRRADPFIYVPGKAPPTPASRTETRTPGTDKSAPQLPKRVPHGKVGGHAHKEGEPHPPQSWPVLARGMRIAMVIARGFT